MTPSELLRRVLDGDYSAAPDLARSILAATPDPAKRVALVLDLIEQLDAWAGSTNERGFTWAGD